MRRWLLASLLCAATPARGADELSGADRLRVVYSNQFAWTREGLPLVTVRVMEGREQVVIGGAGARVLPDGEGGAEVAGGQTWTVRVSGGKPARVRWHVVVARFKPGDARLQAALETWRGRGLQPRTFEIGAVFGIRGQVLDSRRVLVAVAAKDAEAQARAEAQALAQRYQVETSLHPELSERPRGTLEATDERGVTVRNDAILWLAPPPGGVLELRDVDKEGGGREARRYFGKLYVTVDHAGKLAVVNAVPEDKLLAGLVPAEMMPSAPEEALKAQAVAARNELLAKIGTRHLTDPYRLCATQHCQVYAGAGREDPRSTKAVAATRGELLVREGGGLVDAVYSASCGGHTEDNDRAWGGAPDPALRGRPDGDAERPWCARPKNANLSWSRKIDLRELAERAGVGPVTAVEPLEHGVSGRVVKLRVTGERGAKELSGELAIRRLLGGLRSARFELDAQTSGGRLQSLTAVGRGHGHGIGMCQMGAIGLAEAGKTYREILKFYYGGSEVRRMY